VLAVFYVNGLFGDTEQPFLLCLWPVVDETFFRLLSEIKKPERIRFGFIHLSACQILASHFLTDISKIVFNRKTPNKD